MGIFDTNAPTSFNAFGAPTNIWGQGGDNGGWGINPAYLTPAYTAPYRPPYTGGHIANQNPGFFRSLYGVSPMNFRGAPYGVNTAGDEANYFDSLANRPMDFGMSAAQRVGVPLLAFGGATAFARTWQTSMPMGPQGSMLRGWNRMWGGAGAATISGFTGMGARFGGSAASSMITGMFGASALTSAGAGGMAARAAVGLAGGVGGAIGGIGLPLLLAQGAVSAFDNLVSDNYIGVRENANVMRQGFRGVSFGGGMGDQFTGAGLSRGAAARMGTDLTKFGAKDQVFNAREIASMTSMSAQMGLLDNVSGEQLTSRMKTIVNQVKAVMSVAGTTEFKEAIQIMAKLQMAGVSAPNLSSTFSGIGSLSAQAGVNVNRMMNTVGAQGQYLFQANGLTPFIGQITAANSMAGFSSAFRSGLIGSDLMARMGGVEGATQSSLTGQLNAAQTTYNMMRGFNRYTSGTGGQGVIQNISNFGNTFAGNPLAAYGALQRTGRANVSQLMRDEGPLAIYNQARELANINPLIGSRKMNQDELFALLLPMMGNDPRQVEAYMAELGTYQDDKTMNLRRAGMRSNRIQMQKDYLHQTEQTWAMTLPGVQSVMKGYRSLSAGIAGAIGGIYGDTGSVWDNFSANAQGFNVGSPSSLAGGTAEELEQIDGMPNLQMRGTMEGGKFSAVNKNINKNLAAHGADIKKLMRAAESGDAVARRALRGDKDAIQEKADAGLISAKYANSSEAYNMIGALLTLPKEEGNRLQQESQRLSSEMRSGSFGGLANEGEMLQAYRSTWKIQEALDKNPDALRENDALLGQARDLFGSDLSPRDLKNKIQQALGEAADFGVDVSRDYSPMKEGESPSEYAKRSKMRFDPSTRDRSMNASTADKIKGLRGRVEVNKQEQQMNNTRETLMGMGRIDLVAAYDMTNAAKELKEVAGLQKQAAQLVIDKLGKEVTAGSPSGAPSLYSAAGLKAIGNKIMGGDRKQ